MQSQHQEPGKWLSGSTVLAGLASAGLMFFLAGCGESEPAPSAHFELRGEPIAAAAPVSAEAPQPATGEAGQSIAKTSASSVDGSSGTGSPSGIQTEPSVAEESPAATDNPTSEYQFVGFDKLASYEFQVSDELLNPPTNSTVNVSAQTEAQIPKEIKALDKKKVALKGFMLPLKVEGGRVTELLIMKDQSMCCYGAVPKINEWVSVKMVEEGVKPLMDQPITLYGKLNVGEMRENGYLVGIYSMDGDMMADPLDQ